MTTETSTTRLRHRIRLVHAATGAPIGPLTARLIHARRGWTVRTVTGAVVVTARADAAALPAPPHLAVTVMDGALAQLLEFPSAAHLPPHTVEIELTERESVRELRPVPMVLSVTLVAPSTAKPRTGRRVTARATRGPEPRPTIDLNEHLAEPGVYVSEPIEWTAAFTPADLLVDDRFLRTVSLNGVSVVTRFRLVDTT